MNRFTLSSLLLALGMVSANLAQAAGVQKLGYINAVRVYSESITAQAIEDTLQKEFGTQQQNLNAIQAEGIELQKRLSEGKLKGQELKAAEEKLLEISRHYRVAAAELAEEYNLRRHEEFAAMQNNANDIIRNIAQTEGFDLIIQEAVFVRGKFDITDRVIQLLDSKK